MMYCVDWDVKPYILTYSLLYKSEMARSQTHDLFVAGLMHQPLNHLATQGGHLIIIRVAPDIISGPGRNPAKFSFPAPAGYGRRI